MTKKPGTDLSARAAAFQEALRAWYRREARPLPWRQSPSLYKTVVSEFMLQQTQVKTVLPYFARWMEAFPDFPSLSAAPEARVLKLWEGLGYYSRARNLHRLSQEIAARPEPPSTPEDWRGLPGVGPYTAAAISSIAQGARIACVDGNVVRILARLTASAEVQADSASAAKFWKGTADALVPADGPGDHNQAMMELGATVCTRAAPRCLFCPVAEFCAARAEGRPEDYPRFAPKETEKVSLVRVWCEREGALLLHRAAEGARRFAGMHELPSAEQAGIDTAHAARGPRLAKKSRSITRFRITESIHVAPPPAELADGLVWVAREEIDSITLSGPHRRWVEEILSKKT